MHTVKRLHVTPSRHAFPSRLHVTPFRHAFTSRLSVTPFRHAFTSRLYVTPLRHAVTSRLFVPPSRRGSRPWQRYRRREAPTAKSPRRARRPPALWVARRTGAPRRGT